MMLNMTHRGKHCRLSDAIQKGGKSLLCDVEFDIAIVYDVQHDSKRQALLSCVKLRLVQRQTLSCCTMTLGMTQRAAVLCDFEYDREANLNGSM